MDKIQAKLGDTVKPDGWNWAYTLKEDDGFKDAGFPGCQFRLRETVAMKAVNIKTTGYPRWNGQRYQSRCKIEIVFVPLRGKVQLDEYYWDYSRTSGILYHIESC